MQTFLIAFRRLTAGLLLAAACQSATCQSTAAASERIEQMLQTVTAAPLQSSSFLVSYVDFQSLYATTEFERDGWRDLEGSPRQRAEKQQFDALRRVSSFVPYLPYVKLAGDFWLDWLGFDYTALDWTVTIDEPPEQIVYLGFDSLPRDAIEAALAARGLTRSPGEGAVFFAKGEDGAIDPRHRLPGYPFWGELGASERLALLPHALMGSRFAAITAAAVEAPRLASDSEVTALLSAAADPDGGASLLQFTLIADDFSPDAIVAGLMPDTAPEEARAQLEVQAPGPLPPFSMLLLADRQTDAGDEALVALVYDTAAEAGIAVETLPMRLAVYRPWKQTKPLLEVLHVVVEARLVEADGKSVALLRLTQDPAYRGLRKPGLTYRALLRAYVQRDLGWLTWK